MLQKKNNKNPPIAAVFGCRTIIVGYYVIIQPISWLLLCMCIQYRRFLPYWADRSVLFGKGRLYCMHVFIRKTDIYTHGYYIHVKHGQQTLQLNGFPEVNFKQHYIKFETENQKSSLIILLVLFHSICPYINYCLYLFINLNLFFFLLSL